MLDAALRYVHRGWPPIPCCWPVAGRCGCGRGHHGRDIGKAPLLGAGYQHLRPDEAMVRDWWCRWPWANVGVLLEPAGLAVIDADGPNAVAEGTALGLPATYTVRRGDHAHHYYRLPTGVPAGRTTHRGSCRAIDVLAAGYVVAAPSRHASGDTYVGACPIRAVVILPMPGWAADLLRASDTGNVPVAPPTRTSQVQRGPMLSPRLAALLEAGVPQGQRSEAVASLETALVREGYDDSTILGVLMARPWIAAMRPHMDTWLLRDLARLRSKGARPRPWSWVS